MARLSLGEGSVLKEQSTLSRQPTLNALLTPALIGIAVAGVVVGGSLTLLGLLSLLGGASPYSTSGVFCVFQSSLNSRRAGSFSVQEFHKLQQEVGKRFTAVAYSDIPLTISPRGPSIPASFVSANYLTIAQSSFLLGSEIDCKADAYTSCDEAIIDRTVWSDQFGSDPTIVGKTISLSNHPFRIQGVVSAHDPAPKSEPARIWISYQDEESLLSSDWISNGNARWLGILVYPKQNSSRTDVDTFLRQHYAGPTRELLVLSPEEAMIVARTRVRGHLVAAVGSHPILAGWLLVTLSILFAAGLLVRLAPPTSSVSSFWLLTLGTLLLTSTIYLSSGFLLFQYIRTLQPGSERFPIAPDRSALGFTAIALVASVFLLRFSRSYLQQTLTSGKQRASIGKLSSWCKQHRYALLSIVLVVATASYWSNGLFVSDFWEHAAVVRELAAHPLHPLNPILPVATVHAGFTPYGLALGCISRLTGLSAVNTLGLASILNTVLLAWSLHCFISLKFRTRGTDFYALLFMLTLWGFFPWMMSGFLHFSFVVEGASYPSCFAVGVVFLTWYLDTLLLQGSSRWLLIPLIACITLVLLDHPLTAISMLVGLFGLTVELQPSASSLARLAITVAVSIAIALAWPYFSFARLIGHGSASFDSATASLYPGPIVFLSMTCFALLGLPALASRFLKNPFDFVVVLFGCLTLIYIIGWIGGKLTLGRVLFFLLFSIQLALADWLANRTAETSARPAKNQSRRMLAAVEVAVALGALSAVPGSLTALPIFQSTYGEFEFLNTNVGRYDPILADIHSSLKIPTFNGKVVAYPPEHVLFFVNNAPREQNVSRFFSPYLSVPERRDALLKFHPSYVLFNKQRTPSWPEVVVSLRGVASVQYISGDMLLFKVGPS